MICRRLGPVTGLGPDDTEKRLRLLTMGIRRP
jgi:hypothetical protein